MLGVEVGANGSIARTKFKQVQVFTDKRSGAGHEKMYLDKQAIDCMYPNRTSQDLGKAGADDVAHVVIERYGVIPGERPTVARNVEYPVEMAPITGRIAPGPQRISLGVEPTHRTECGILVEYLCVIVGIKFEMVASVTDEASGGVI